VRIGYYCFFEFFMIEPRGLGRKLSAQYMGVSPSLFDKLVKDGLMPQPIAIYSRRVWDRRALDDAFTALAGGNFQTAPAEEWKVAL
jgi:hypothetical protein